MQNKGITLNVFLPVKHEKKKHSDNTNTSRQINYKQHSFEWQGWPSGESTCPPPMWPISRLGVICGLSLLVLFSSPRGFSPGTPVFPSHQKPTFDLT